MRARLVVLVLSVASFAAAPAVAAKSITRKHAPLRPGSVARIAPDRAPPDDLYRRRGYGQGGLLFGGSRNGTALAGACADVAFARPLPCEPGSGYGVYGNGLGYPFGF